MSVAPPFATQSARLRAWDELVLGILDDIPPAAPAMVIHDKLQEFLDAMRDPAAFFLQTKLPIWTLLNALSLETPDSIGAIIIDEMTRVMGVENCDFQSTQHGLTPLHFAIRSGCTKTMTQICIHGDPCLDDSPPIIMDDIAYASSYMISSLCCYISRRPSYELANKRVRNGGTALHAICEAPRSMLEIAFCVRDLVRLGVDPTILNAQGVSPRSILEARGLQGYHYTSTIRLLEQHETPEKSWGATREVLRLPGLPMELRRLIGRQTFGCS